MVVDDAKYGEFGGKPGGGYEGYTGDGYGGYQGGRSRDTRILIGPPGGRHPCGNGNRNLYGPPGCPPADHDAETEAKPQN